MRPRNRLMPKLKSLGGYSGELEILNFSCFDCAKFTLNIKKTQIFHLIRYLLRFNSALHLQAERSLMA